MSPGSAAAMAAWIALGRAHDDRFSLDDADASRVNDHDHKPNQDKLHPKMATAHFLPPEPLSVLFTFVILDKLFLRLLIIYMNIRILIKYISAEYVVFMDLY